MCFCVSVHVCSIEVCVCDARFYLSSIGALPQGCVAIFCVIVYVFMCVSVCVCVCERGVCVIHRSMYVSVGIFAQGCAVMIRMFLCVCVCASVCARV